MLNYFIFDYIIGVSWVTATLRKILEPLLVWAGTVKEQF